MIFLLSVTNADSKYIKGDKIKAQLQRTDRADMAKLRPAGSMRPFNFFLRPADLLLLFKILPNRHLKASKNDKLEKKMLKKFCFAVIVIIKSVYSNSAALYEN